MDDREAIAALVSDLYWQIDQMKPRGIRDKAGNPYNPSYYKRGLKTAVSSGGLAVADFVKSYLTKAPSAGYKKLEESDSLDLACEALVADESKPYAYLFTAADRDAAKARLAPYVKAIEARKAAQQARIDDRHTDSPATSTNSATSPPRPPIRSTRSRSTPRSSSRRPRTSWR